MTLPANALMAADAEFRTAGPGRPAADLVRWSAAGLLGMLVLAALVLSWRRLGGGLSRPLGFWEMAVVALAVAGLAAAVHTARRFAASPAAGDRLHWPAAAAISAAVLTLGAAVSLPGTSPAALAVLWAVLGGEESWAWLRGVRRRRRLQSAAAAVGPAIARPKPQPERSAAAASDAVAAMGEPPDADVLQRLTRSRSPRGIETLSGWLRVPLAAGQRSASVHVAFCPPFARIPKTAIKQLQGPEVRIKTVQLLPFGIRFDVKLSSVSGQAENLLLQFAAQLEPLESGKAGADSGRAQPDAEKSDVRPPPSAADASSPTAGKPAG